MRSDKRPEVSFNLGKISSLRYDDDQLSLLQLDVRANPGNSGGPVISKKGEVIGVLSAKLSGFESMDFAIPVSSLKQFAQPYLGGEGKNSFHGGRQSFEEFLQSGSFSVGEKE